MSQPIELTPKQQTQQTYEALCREEKRLGDQLAGVRDSGKASPDLILQHHQRFNDAIRARSAHKKRFPGCVEPSGVFATVKTNFKRFDPANVCGHVPWLFLKGEKNDQSIA